MYASHSPIIRDVLFHCYIYRLVWSENMLFFMNRDFAIALNIVKLENLEAMLGATLACL